MDTELDCLVAKALKALWEASDPYLEGTEILSSFDNLKAKFGDNEFKNLESLHRKICSIELAAFELNNEQNPKYPSLLNLTAIQNRYSEEEIKALTRLGGTIFRRLDQGELIHRGNTEKQGD